MESIEPIKPKEIKTRLPKHALFEFSKWMKANSYSYNTIKNYCIHLNSLLKGNKKRLVDTDNYLSPEKIKAFLNKKNSLVKKSAVKNLLIFLEDDYKIKIDPFRYPRIKKESKIIIPITPLEIEKLIEDIAKDKEEKYRIYDFVLFTKVIFIGGLRLSEAVRSRIEWINWKKWMENKEDFGEIKIIKAKNNKERIVPLSPEIMQEIFDYALTKSKDDYLEKGLLFDYDYDKYLKKQTKKGIHPEIAESRYILKVCNTYQRIIRSVSEKVLGRRIHTHLLRHSRATELDSLGVRPSIIQTFLGHDSLLTTSKYIHNTSQQVKEGIKKATEKI